MTTADGEIHRERRKARGATSETAARQIGLRRLHEVLRKGPSSRRAAVRLPTVAEFAPTWLEYGRAGLGYLGSLRTTATQRGTSLPFTPGAEALLAAMLAPAGGDVDPAPAVEQAQESVSISTPEEARACAALEDVLSGEFGLDAAECREGVGWYRFTIAGISFQGGLHDDLRVLATLCRTDTDVNLTKLMASIRAANAGRVDVRFDEADGYIQVRAACRFSEVSAESIKAMIEACRAAIGSEAGAGLRAKYRSYE